MSKNLIKDLPELVDANVITAETAERIQTYYRRKDNSSNRLVVVFSILGALLVGLGIILIIAHNWDELSKGVKLTFAMLPLLISQLLCGFVLWRKSDSVVWREASAVALMMSVAAAISIVSQVYNIEGSLGSFLFTWMCVSIPIVYVMRSMMASLLVIAGITWYAVEISYFDYPTSIAWYYWVMLAVTIPFYFFYVIRQPGKNFKIMHAWFLAASLLIALGMFGKNDEEWLFVAYISLLSAFTLTSEWMTRKNIPGAFAFLFLASIGQAWILLVLSFEFVWKELRPGYSGSLELLLSVFISFLTAVFLVFILRDKDKDIHPLSFVFLLFIPTFVAGAAYPIVGQIITNILVLGIALITTKRGADQDNLIILNYGLIIFAALVLCRFFDTRLSFFVRGLMFIAVGASFFAANYYTLKKRKSLQL